MAFCINVYCFYCIALKSQGVGGLDQNPPYGSATTLERLLNLLTRNEKPEGVLYSSWRWHSVMRNANPLCFSVSGKNFTGNEKFQGNIYPKPEESPEDKWIFIVNNVMSLYDLYETISGFLFLVSKFSNLCIMLAPHSTALTRRLFYPFPLAKIPSNYRKKSQITSPHPIFSCALVKTPFFSRFHYAGAAGQKHP